MSYSQEQTTSYQEDTSKSENPSSGGGQGKGSMSNSQALEQLTGANTKKTSVDLNSAQDGPSFASAASKALDSVVPGPGSSANLKVSGKLPIYATGALNAYLMPALSLGALRLSSGKLKVTIDSELGLRAEAGTGGGGGWWPKFLAYFQGKIKGTIRIVGDDAQEIFNELLLTFRLVLEQACEAAGAPDSLTDAIAGGIDDVVVAHTTEDQRIEMFFFWGPVAGEYTLDQADTTLERAFLYDNRINMFSMQEGESAALLLADPYSHNHEGLSTGRYDVIEWNSTLNELEVV